MSAFFGDLIVPDVDPLEAAATLPAYEVRAALEALGNFADKAGAGTLWQRAVLVGTDGAPDPPGPARGVVGISLAWACVAGIGYWRDHYLPREPLPPPTPAQPSSKFLDFLRTKSASEASIRGPEVDALRRTLAAAGNAAPFPLKVLVDIGGTWAYSFEGSYRRRLAYALAFEASIRTGSLEPYTSFAESLAVANAPDFISELSTIETRGAFSVFLNLVSLLDRMLAAESTPDSAQGTPVFRVVDAEAKRSYLVAQLKSAAAQRSSSLTEDGKIALRALLAELDLLRGWGITPLSPLPRWGILATSEAYV